MKNIKSFSYKQCVKFIPHEIFQLNTELKCPSPIYFGHDIEEQFIEKLKEHESDQVFFLTEEPVFEFCGKPLYEKIKKNIQVELEFVPPGESCKYFSILEEICENLIKKGISKKSILIAFGGGTVGNIVGMVAGLIYRGIRFIEIPTTMTAQTDSTLSNKQAINGRTGKNHFGFYYSPILIWTDTKYLETEPLISKSCGVIEGIKNGLISNLNFLDYLEETINPQLSYSPSQLFELTYKIILSKLEIIRKDPSEKHYGIILEYGHTFGHAIEWLQQGKMSHGEAVSFGMKIEAHISQTLGLISDKDVDRHYFLIEKKLGFTRPLPETLTVENLLFAISSDNKKTGGAIRFVLLEKMGKCYNPEGDFLVSVDAELVKKSVHTFMSRNRKILR
ncbi:MAG: 2-deoxy-scyllo-inosose synthase [Pseudomonadota bacterium]